MGLQGKREMGWPGKRWRVAREERRVAREDGVAKEREMGLQKKERELRLTRHPKNISA